MIKALGPRGVSWTLAMKKVAKEIPRNSKKCRRI
jgi:hypothetical protein